MKSWTQRLKSVGFVAVLMGSAGLLQTAQVVGAEVVGTIDGFEIALQGGSHGALFVFGFEGQVDGRAKKGWGWIEVFHEPLPEPGGEPALISGHGVLWIGLRRYTIDNLAGSLAASETEDAIFEVEDGILDITDRRDGSVPHDFAGALSHQTFPPTISGTIAPGGAGGG